MNNNANHNTANIYILLTDTGTWFTRLIKVFTRAEMNHASIALDSELAEVYSFGRKRPRNPFIGGFVKEDLASDLFEGASCAVYGYTVDKETYERIRQRIQEFERNQQKYSYNLLGLFGVLLRTRIPRKDAYFCTQFVASVLMENGIAICEKPPELTTPTDFERAPVLKRLYSGSLRHYRRAAHPAA